ncbi:integrase [Gossypium australe]|uniref:Integrase n=1 Tax=Gossypium australe TaxID=47621 RepID=A0A5B6W711_9ROSI|nr:integrase [Gossypium australe]
MPHLYGSQKLKELDVTERFESLLKDYEFVIDYHPGNANVVDDALSRISLFALRAMNTQLMVCDDGSILAELKAKPIGIDDCLRFQNRIFIPRNSKLI